MVYAVAVMVVDRRSRRGLAGQRVKCYGGPELKTDASGRATVVSGSSSITVHVNGDRAPVTLVSRHDAQRFIGWLNKKEGTRAYRLPSEAKKPAPALSALLKAQCCPVASLPLPAASLGV